MILFDILSLVGLYPASFYCLIHFYKRLILI